MRCNRWGMVAAMAGSLWFAAAWGETPDEYRDTPISAPSGAPASKPRVNRPVFAAEAAATARPLEPHERDERRFLKDAAASSRFQVDAARLALARSTDGGVRSLAAALSADHGAAGNQVLRMLHQRGLAPPMLENAQRRALGRLARLQGPKFDREYVAALTAQAKEEAAACEKAEASVQDPALADWIARSVPALHAQVERAEGLAATWHAAPRSVPRHAPRRAAHGTGGVSASSSR